MTNESIYEWDDTKNELQVLNTQLAMASELTNPLTYYGEGGRFDSLRIAYISDIHLSSVITEAFQQLYSDIGRNVDIHKVKPIVRKLYPTNKSANITIFCGDIADKKTTTVDFFKHYKYSIFQKFKAKLNRCKNNKKKLSEGVQSQYSKCLNNTNRYIEIKMDAVKKNFDFARFEKYKKTYHSNIGYEEAYAYFKKTNSFKKCKLTKKMNLKSLKY